MLTFDSRCVTGYFIVSLLLRYNAAVLSPCGNKFTLQIKAVCHQCQNHGGKKGCKLPFMLFAVINAAAYKLAVLNRHQTT